MNPIIHKIKGYLGYGVKCEYLWTAYDNEYITNSGVAILDDILFDKGEGNYKYIYIKPILRPLESLTDEEMVKVNNIIMYNAMGAGLKDWKNAQFKDGLRINYKLRYIEKDGYLGKNGLFDELVDYFCELHIDYQDLIGQGLGIELTNKE